MDPCNCGLNHLFRDCPTEGNKSDKQVGLGAVNAPAVDSCAGCDESMLDDPAVAAQLLAHFKGESEGPLNIHFGLMADANASDQPADHITPAPYADPLPKDFSKWSPDSVRTFDTEYTSGTTVGYFSVTVGPHSAIY